MYFLVSLPHATHDRGVGQPPRVMARVYIYTSGESVSLIEKKGLKERGACTSDYLATSRLST